MRWAMVLAGEAATMAAEMVERIGNCRILGEIGGGGMAIVYKAVQEPLGRLVAIKALKPSIAADSHFAKRFEREALFMASLQHENILHVIDFIKDGTSMYIVMEYVEGIDLHDLLDRAGRLPVDVAAIVALQTARALDYVHFRGIVHRDIKPANLMISKQGEVKLMDFGIARDERLADLTETGTGVGTPSYMSPEQILGDRLDFRSDIFSLGIVLYQMVTGRKPFVEDEQRTVMQKIRLDRYTPPRKLNPSVPRHMERILARCLEKLPANRYPTTRALIDDLVEFLAPRVPMNYQARMVMYLREVGVVGEQEAARILEAGGSSPSLREGRDPRLLRQMAWTQGIVGALMLGGALLLQARDGGLKLPGTVRAEQRAAALDPREMAYLKVVVRPWADVLVDGRQVLTTPSDRAIPLPPGVHYVRLRNPYFRDVDRTVHLDKGQTMVLREALEPLGAPDGGAPAPLEAP